MTVNTVHSTRQCIMYLLLINYCKVRHWSKCMQFMLKWHCSSNMHYMKYFNVRYSKTVIYQIILWLFVIVKFICCMLYQDEGYINSSPLIHICMFKRASWHMSLHIHDPISNTHFYSNMCQGCLQWCDFRKGKNPHLQCKPFRKLLKQNNENKLENFSQHSCEMNMYIVCIKYTPPPNISD